MSKPKARGARADVQRKARKRDACKVVCVLINAYRAQGGAFQGARSMVEKGQANEKEALEQANRLDRALCELHDELNRRSGGGRPHLLPSRIDLHSLDAPPEGSGG